MRLAPRIQNPWRPVSKIPPLVSLKRVREFRTFVLRKYFRTFVLRGNYTNFRTNVLFRLNTLPGPFSQLPTAEAPEALIIIVFQLASWSLAWKIR